MFLLHIVHGFKFNILIDTPLAAAKKYLSKKFSQIYCIKIEQIQQMKEKNKSKM